MTNAQKTLDEATSAHQRYLLKPSKEDLTLAINGYIETIKENPQQTSAYYHLATLLHKNGQIGLESAIEQCTKAVSINPEDANAHMYLGYFLSLNQEFDRAKNEFRQAIKLNPSMGRTRLVLALTMLEKIKTLKSKSELNDYTNALYYGVTGGLMSIFDTTGIKLLVKNIKEDINFIKQNILGSIFEKIKDEKRAYNIYLSTVDNSKKSINFMKKWRISQSKKIVMILRSIASITL